MKPKVGIISAGALGTALAQSISKNNDNILLWGRNPELINEINNEHTNSKYYPNFQLNITGIDDLEKLYDCNVIILAIPSSVIREMMEKLAKIISPDCAIITTIKGIELSSYKTMSQIINEYVDNETYVLSGPNIAKEIMNNFPAATSIAGKGDYRLIESVFDKSNMKVDYNDDIIGTEFCGIIKNIIAISQGILEGMDINYNAKLAFFTKSFLEAKDIIEKLAAANITPTSMMDISDGLSSELMHICKQSNTGCRVYEEHIPIDYQTAVMAEEFNMNLSTCALNGGEDYALLFTVPLTAHEVVSQMKDVKVIGHITKPELGCALVTRDGNELELKAQGWNPLKG